MTPLRVSDNDLRFLWKKAAWFMLRLGHVRDAREAWRNSRSDRPPERWSTGVHLFGLDEHP